MIAPLFNRPLVNSITARIAHHFRPHRLWEEQPLKFATRLAQQQQLPVHFFSLHANQNPLENLVSIQTDTKGSADEERDFICTVSKWSEPTV